MTSSSSPSPVRALDAMLITYSLLDGHPASAACEEHIRSHAGWLTTSFTLLEVKAILTKVYQVEGGARRLP